MSHTLTFDARNLRWCPNPSLYEVFLQDNQKGLYLIRDKSHPEQFNCVTLPAKGPSTCTCEGFLFGFDVDTHQYVPAKIAQGWLGCKHIRLIHALTGTAYSQGDAIAKRPLVKLPFSPEQLSKIVRVPLP